jgi:hypothetical protein
MAREGTEGGGVTDMLLILAIFLVACGLVGWMIYEAGLL